jgi:YVTN family beta-propeller protein
VDLAGRSDYPPEIWNLEGLKMVDINDLGSWLGRLRAPRFACASPLLVLVACSSSSGSKAGPNPEAGTLGPPGTIYVSMYGDDDITVIDQATHAIVKTIPIGKGPAVMVATPDNKKLYTADWSGNTVSAVDIATAAVTSVALDGRPWAIAMSPSGKTVYAALTSDKIVGIDTTTDAIASTIDTTPDYEESLIVSADGNTLYVDPTSSGTISPGNTLEGLSTDGGVLQAPITVGSTPAFASISPDGSRVYTLNFLDGTVSVADTKSWSVLATIDTGAGSQPIISSSTPDGLLVVTNFGLANLVTVDFATNKIVNTLALDGRPVGVGGYNSDGTLGYVCDFGHASLAPESITDGLAFLNGDLSGFVGQGPGNVSAFNPVTGKKIGDSIVVGKGPTSVVVIAP